MKQPFWARLVRALRGAPVAGLTREQNLALRRYDAEVTARPDAIAPLLDRARFLERSGGEFDGIVADLRAALRLRPEPQTWRHSRGLLELCCQNWAFLQQNLRIVDVRHWRAHVVSSFEVALELETDTALWLKARGARWGALEILERAANEDFARPEWQSAAPDELKVWAFAVAVARHSPDWQQAAATNALAAELYARALKSQPDKLTERALSLARDGDAANYQRLAGWNVLVEAAPDDVRWRVGRGNWLKKQHDNRAARADFTRAIEFAPGDPALYEARAAAADTGAIWWETAPDSTGASADYGRALKLRIAAGEVKGAPAQLAKQAALLKPRFKKRGDYKQRAHAFYSLALELEPDNAAHYLGRAQTLDIPPFRGRGCIEAQLESAHHDYLRALARNENLIEAREAVSQYLTRTLARPTAHQQIEALLEARALMLETGVSARLANEIIGEVERALAG